jgi:hypothetical protein
LKTVLLTFLAVSTILADDSTRWAFDPKPDDFKPDALLDLRSLNEDIAGQSGFVRTDGEGNFVRGDGQPLRFWAVGSSAGMQRPWAPRPLWSEVKTAPSLECHARFLAKHGVNLARMHVSLNPNTKKNPGAQLDELSTDTRDYIWEFVAAMKKAGIYSMLTPYWANAFKPTPSMGFGTDDAHGLLFFDPKLKAAYKTWMRELLTTKNPHTGIPLAEDASLAVIQIQNEDATHFWTISHLKEQPMAMLNEQFKAWAIKKHGSAEAVAKAWSSDKPIALANIFELTKDATSPKLDDQTEFWSRLMFDFHRDIVEFLRKDCGCKQLISAGNWHTADTLRLNDPLRWTYTATDIQGVNRYFPGAHGGDDMAAWAVKSGQTYNSRSFVTNPFDWPLQLKLPVKQPFVITESSWTFPSQTASEAPFLVASYQGLTGFDALCWFVFESEQWIAPHSANGFVKDTQTKFIAAYPDCLGQFPAAAIIARNGYVKQGVPAVREARPLNDLWQRSKPLIAEAGDYSSGKADPRAFFVGPVEVEYGVDASKTTITDISKQLDADTIRSNTNEHELNSKEGWFTLNTPCAQGVAAFFKNRRDFDLPDVKIHSDNDYGTCVLVSMDGKPLSESKKVLIQVGTTTRPAGWQDSEISAEAATGKKGKPIKAKDLRRIDNVGHAPWMVERGKFTVTLKRSDLKKATALDANGYATETLSPMINAGSMTLTLPENVLHVVVE